MMMRAITILLSMLAAPPHAQPASLSLAAAPAGQTEYAVIVHEDNQVKGFSTVDLVRTFKLENQHWGDKSKSKVTLFLPKSGSADMAFLLSDIYKMSEKDLQKYWVQLIYQNKISDRPKQLPAGKVLLRAIAKKTGAISIVDASLVAGDHPGIRIVPIDGKLPGQEGYPLHASSDSVAILVEAASPVYASAPQEGGDDATVQRLDELEEQLFELQFGDDSEEGFGFGPKLQLKGFGHVSFSLDDLDDGSNGSDAFALGGVDLFISSQLADNLTFLNETVFEPTPEGDYVLDVERVIIKYEVNDFLNVQAGRFHTTIGYWNEAYHHGEWLQTTIGRPGLFNFEDDGGVLPVHLVGVVLKGRKDSDAVGLDYTLEVGNGRGPTPDPPQIVVDANDAKAVNVSVGVQPTSVEGLRVGGGVYLDKIPANGDAGAGSVHSEADEQIVSLFGTYMANDWEVLAEFIDISHDFDTGGEANSDGWYLQVGRAFDSWTPYARIDSVTLDDADTYYANVDDREALSVGVRWDYSDWSALKLQYTSTDVDVAGGGSRTEDSLVLQCSFAF